MRRLGLLLAFLPLAACHATKEAPSGAGHANPSTPLWCVQRAQADRRAPIAELDRRHLLRLCAGATTANGPLECYVAAKSDGYLGLSNDEALTLCAR
jgi:hypothetical protein